MSLRFKKIFEKQSKKLVTFTTGGDPDLDVPRSGCGCYLSANTDG